MSKYYLFVNLIQLTSILHLPVVVVAATRVREAAPSQARVEERLFLRTGRGAAVSVDREEETHLIDALPGAYCPPACAIVSSHTTEAHIALTEGTVLRTPNHHPRWFLPYVWPVQMRRRHPPQIPTG
jgi:hypothetical protein